MIPPDLAALATAQGQQHLLQFWDELSPADQAQLAKEIEAVDFELLQSLLAAEQSDVDWNDVSQRATSPDAIRLQQTSAVANAAAKSRGEAALRAGEVGVVLVAGGQGTRLGFHHPKGMYKIGPVSGQTLFQILLEKVLAASRRYGVAVPLVVMTSPATHDETDAYLREQAYFGLPAADVRLCCQGTMPAVELAGGKLLLAERGRLALSPDGHGGLVAAMSKSGALTELQQRGVRQLFYMQVDNPLVVACDPVFIGHHLLAGAEMSTQVVAKDDPLDRVGNLASLDGRALIIEYSDLPEAAARRRHDDGSLVFWAGNIAVHVLDVPFLQRVANSSDSLPFHRARKKVAFVDTKGSIVEPTKENAYKFERFIFDLLPAARKTIAVEVAGPECFAPVKNEPGAAKDTPESAQRLMVALHTAWLRAAGVEVAAGAPVEISPLFALDADELATRVTPGTKITSATFFAPPTP